jgi:hypothetical protein
MRETIALILIALGLMAVGAVVVHLRLRAAYERWLRSGRADYSKAHPRRGLFG